MHRAINKLSVEPELLLIDGNRFKRYHTIAHNCIIGGDGLFLSIAAASVLAKTYRDEYMLKIHNEFPLYSWHTNKGYGTEEHRKAIIENGFSPYHRRTFKVLDPQLELEFL
jgi:ribonuclease HII